MSVMPPSPLSYLGEVAVPFINKPFPPTSAFNKFKVPTVWIDTVLKEAWILTSNDLGTAEWVKIGDVDGVLQSLLSDDGSPAVIPDGDGNITIAGGAGITTTGQSPSTSLSVALSANAQATAINSWDGALVEKGSTSVSSDGATITLSAEKDGGGDLIVIFSDGFYVWDTTPADTVTLTAGTDTVPVKNYVYMPRSTKTLTSSTVGWPAEEILRVATVVCPTAALTQTDSPYAFHQWLDDTKETNGQGHITDITFWIRSQNATWETGVVQSYNITTNIGTPDNVIFTTTAGVVLQLHENAFPAFTGTPDIYIVNHPTTPYLKITDINAINVDSLNATLVGRYYSLVIWGVQSQNGDSKLFLNLPGGSYNNLNGVLEDASKYADYSIPQAYRGTGFLISEWKMRQTAVSGGTWTSEDEIDLRGLFPSIVPGGTAAFPNEFADLVFRVYDDADDTKKIALDAGNITPATTRTITMADEDIDLAVAALHTSQLIVSAGGLADGANYTTIASAITAASSGDTIYICDGTYTEDLTLKNGVNLVSLSSSGGFASNSVSNVTIVGKMTAGAVSSSISGCRLQTNSDFCIEATGACAVSLFNCKISATNNTAISMSNSGANVILQQCNVNLSTTGITLVSNSGGVLWVIDSDIRNSGGSTTATTISAGTLYAKDSTLIPPIATSSTGRFQLYNCIIDSSALNITPLTTAGNQDHIISNCNISSGSASSVSIGTGTTVEMYNSNVKSSATNALTGAGTLKYGSIVFNGTSSGYNVTTLTSLPVFGTAYASGTWTPGIAFGGGTTGITYATQIGRYTKIGNIVHITLLIELSSKGTDTGNVTITGLPFTPNGFTEQSIGPFAENTALTFDASYVSLFMDTSGVTGTAFPLFQYNPAAAAIAVDDTNFANNTRLQSNLFYFTVS